MKAMFNNRERGCAMKTHLRIFSILSFVLLLAVSPALAGGPWFVATDGNDANNGLASDNAHAFLTIQHAIGQASSGDVINIGAGTFHEAVSIPSGKSSLQLVGAGASSTTITS